MRAITIFVAVLFLCRLCTANDDAQALIEGAAARYGAVKSGRLHYLYEGATKRKGPDGKELDSNPEFFTFDGTNWAHGWTTQESSTAHFKGVYCEYFASPDRSSVTFSSVDPNAHPRALNDPPVFAGSFWYAEQPPFVREYIKEFKLVGTQTIEGVETKVCEMPRTRGGRVRLCIAPQLGFVLPLVEFLDPEGYADVRFVASSFTEVKPGLWLPGSIKHGIAHPIDPSLPMRYHGFSCMKYELINETIPDEYFSIKLRRGTRVVDHRRNRSSRYPTSIDDGVTTGDLIKAAGGE